MCELLSVLCSPDMNAVEQLEMKQVGARVGGLSVEGERYGERGIKERKGGRRGGFGEERMSSYVVWDVCER